MFRTYHEKWHARKHLVTTVLACFLFNLSAVPVPGAGAVAQDVPPSVSTSTEAEIAEDTARVNCKDSTRMNSVRQLWQRMGAPQTEISDVKFGVTHNLVFRKKAAIETNETIVIGAHYDKTVMGCGAIDNWTGIVAISHIIRSVKELPLKKNLIFVAFGDEERGLLGSRAMIKAVPSNEIGNFCAMINIDSLGMAPPMIASNLSSKTLSTAALKVAESQGIKASYSELAGAGADSVPFMEKNIPAVTIVGLGAGWQRILHSPFDQVKSVKMPEVYQGYKLALHLLINIDGLECRVFAPPQKKK